MTITQIFRFLLLLTLVLAQNLSAQPQADNPIKQSTSITVSPASQPVTDVMLSESPVIDMAVLEPESASTSVRDIMLVLDNSPSMKTTDPLSKLSGAVTEFVARLDDDTRIGLILFDQDVRIIVPLTPATIANRESITGALAQLNYAGQHSDSASAIEKAVTELKTNGRSNASQYIVFLTDGAIDTGDTNRDNERSNWLQQSFAVDIAESGIKLLGVGLAEAAGSELVSTVSLRSGGESFTAMQAEELSAVFARVNDYILQNSGPVLAAVTENSVTQAAITESPAPPVVQTTPAVAPVQVAGSEDRTRSMIIMIAIVILILTLGALVVILIKRGRLYQKVANATVSEAYLYDLNNRTSTPRYKLGTKATMFGRVAGKDSGHLDYIVIPESTIGRRHATIEYKDYAYWIMDQGSINGTFVNDVRVNSETRLKHGDRIRLHKIEFDFIMPDMEEAGMTRVAESAAVAAVAGNEVELDINAIKSSLGEQAFDLDLGFGVADTPPAGMPIDKVDETLMPGFGSVAVQEESSEVTLMPDYNQASKPDAMNKPAGRMPPTRSKSKIPIDETLVKPGYSGTDNEDATLRPDTNSSSDGLFDVTGADDKDR